MLHIAFKGLLIGGLVASCGAFASGFEKSIPWGGQTSGVAGIGTPYMQGSEALYFNPAGLVSDKVGQDVSLNVSPTFPKFQGPLAHDSSESSQSKMLVPFGLIYGATLNDKIGFGVGGYVSGGTYADYTGVDVSPLKGSDEALGDLIVTELAAGVGYKVMEGLKIGASWRVVTAKANFDLIEAGPAANTLANAKLHDLKDTQYTGFKLGAQYKLNETTNFGLTYRSEVNFKAKGTMDGTINTGAGTSALAATPASVGTTLPAAVTLGATHDINESWKILGEYVWTQYSKVTNLAVNSDAYGAAPFELQFKDQNQVRLAGEYKGWGTPLRFGYIWTSQVTNSDHALAILTPPSSANTLTVGSGHGLNVAGQNFQLDGGLEYTWASGTGTGRSADYKVSEYAVHLGAIYNF